MNPDSWVAMIGLGIGVCGIAINVGLFLGRLKTLDARCKSLEEARGRMGDQLHRAVRDLAVLATIVDEREAPGPARPHGRHHRTLAGLRGRGEGEGEDAATPEGEISAEQSEPP